MPRPSKREAPIASPESQLASACDDFVSALDRHVAKATAYLRQRTARRLGVTVSSLPNQSDKLPVPAPDQIRERLRKTRMVPVSSEAASDGAALSEFWSVYPVETPLSGDAYTLAIDKVTQSSASEYGEGVRRYNILVDGDRAWTVRDGQTLTGSDLFEPLQIITQARDLYN